MVTVMLEIVQRRLWTLIRQCYAVRDVGNVGGMLWQMEVCFCKYPYSNRMDHQQSTAESLSVVYHRLSFQLHLPAAI